jgi:hypothetical protein
MVQTESLKYGLITKNLYLVGTTFVRLSLLSFYYRLLGSTNHRGMLYALHASVAFVLVIFVVFTFLGIFICR